MYVIKGQGKNIFASQREQLQGLSETAVDARGEKEPDRVSNPPLVGAAHTWTADEIGERIDAAFDALRDPPPWDDYRSRWDYWDGPAADYRLAHDDATASNRCQLRRRDQRKIDADIGLGIEAHEFASAHPGATMSVGRLLAELGFGQEGDTRDLSGWSVETGHRATWPQNKDELRRQRGTFRVKCKGSPAAFTELANRDEATSLRAYPINADRRGHEALTWLMDEPDGASRRIVIAFGRSRLSIRDFCLKHSHWPDEFARLRRSCFRNIAARLNAAGVSPTPSRTSPSRFGPGIAVGVAAVAVEFGVKPEEVRPLLASGEKPIATHGNTVVALRQHEPPEPIKFPEPLRSPPPNEPKAKTAQSGFGIWITFGNASHAVKTDGAGIRAA